MHICVHIVQLLNSEGKVRGRSIIGMRLQNRRLLAYDIWKKEFALRRNKESSVYIVDVCLPTDC